MTIFALAVFCLPDIRATGNPGAEATAQLSLEVYLQPAPAEQAGPALFRSLYWLRMATTLGDMSPSAVLRVAYQRARRAPYPSSSQLRAINPSDPAPYEDQFLADWHIACVYGLFTPENLTRLQAGSPPIATDGPYKGQTIQARLVSAVNRSYPVTSFALGPEQGPVPADALPASRLPDPKSPVIAQAMPGYVPPPPPPPFLAPSAGISHPRNIPMPNWQQPSKPVLAGTDESELTPAHVLVQDVPFNGLLPMEGKVKLGIAGVTDKEISVSIVGEKQVAVKYPNGGVMFNPSINNYKVPKMNPVHLPGVPNNAYLIKEDHAGRTGVEVRYYLIDQSVDNGATYRVAKVVGGL